MTDTLAGLLSIALLVALLAVAYVPVGDYMARVFTSTRHLRIERAVYRLTGVGPDAEQSPRSYATSVVGLTLVSVALLMGILLAQAHGASAFAYPLIFLPFLSSAFVPTETMPGPVRAFAENQPVTSIVDALRGLLDG